MHLLAKHKLNINNAVLGTLAAISILVFDPLRSVAAASPVTQSSVPNLDDPAERDSHNISIQLPKEK